MVVDNCGDFQASTAFGPADLIPATFRRGKRRANRTFRFIDRFLVSRFIVQTHRNVPQHFATALGLKAVMKRFVIGQHWVQHVALDAGVQSPEFGFQDIVGGHRSAATPTYRRVFFRVVS